MLPEMYIETMSIVELLSADMACVAFPAVLCCLVVPEVPKVSESFVAARDIADMRFSSMHRGLVTPNGALSGKDSIALLTRVQLLASNRLKMVFKA
jgi:hypothetical protein